ncbi:MAG: glycoside hydrolase family 3 N-terminal domain-containing protein [Candidatus Methylacidiphilales bacterium]|nr:glycoside hydrolase family 3 N-terminal domain-containing protein [Candidatus Methylacidiphilales bacterium]
MTAPSLTGQPIVMGVPGPELTDGLRDLIRRVQPGGFILFGRNLASAEQVYRLISEFYELCHQTPIVTIDQEGGRVSRLKLIGQEPPSGYDLCLAGREDWCEEHGVLTGRLLKLFGFNLNLAPVVDWSIDEERDNSLRGRCLGRTVEEVQRNASAFLRGMESQGVRGTAKHFPGYTYCALDPHGELPRIDRTRAEMEKEELQSFRNFLHASAFMVGHGFFPAWHSDALPASLSRKVVTDLLRGELGYRGLVMTDDLEMGAIANHYPSESATRLAMEAGHDILLYCHNPACVQIASDVLESLPSTLLEPALARISAFKKTVVSIPPAFDAQAFAAINDGIRALREKVRAQVGK